MLFVHCAWVCVCVHFFSLPLNKLCNLNEVFIFLSLAALCRAYAIFFRLYPECILVLVDRAHIHPILFGVVVVAVVVARANGICCSN